MKNRLPLLFLISLIFTILLSACSDDPWYYVPELKPTNNGIPTEIPPTPTPFNNTGEARIRYMMADMFLGAPIDYYEAYPDDAEIVEAVSRVKQGYSIQNLYDFERKIVGETGWLVVYAGNENMINGMDVILQDPPTVMEWCNAENITLTPEETMNCGTHTYTQVITYEKRNDYGVECINHSSSVNPIPGPFGGIDEWTFRFLPDTVLPGSPVHRDFGQYDQTPNKTGTNTYTFTHVALNGDINTKTVITFTNTGFTYEDFDFGPTGWDGLCGAMTATLQTTP